MPDALPPPSEGFRPGETLGSDASTNVPPPPPPATGSLGTESLGQIPIGTRPGDLTFTWRSVLAAGWTAAFFAYAGVWQASVQIGIATWWVGPRSAATPTMIRIIPFVLVIAMALLVVYNVPRLPLISLVGAGLSALVAVPDFSRSVGLAVTELIIAAGLAVMSITSFTGRYRLTAAVPQGATTDPSPLDVQR